MTKNSYPDEAARDAAEWMIALVGMPRAMMQDESRWVQLVGLPRAAQHALTSWAVRFHPEDLELATDSDGALRSVPESLYHAWIQSLFFDKEIDA